MASLGKEERKRGREGEEEGRGEVRQSVEAEDSGRLIVSVVVYSFIIHQDFSKSYITEVVANDNSFMEPE